MGVGLVVATFYGTICIAVVLCPAPRVEGVDGGLILNVEGVDGCLNIY